MGNISKIENLKITENYPLKSNKNTIKFEKITNINSKISKILELYNKVLLLLLLF